MFSDVSQSNPRGGQWGALRPVSSSEPSKPRTILTTGLAMRIGNRALGLPASGSWSAKQFFSIMLTFLLFTWICIAELSSFYRQGNWFFFFFFFYNSRPSLFFGSFLVWVLIVLLILVMDSVIEKAIFKRMKSNLTEILVNSVLSRVI